MEMRTNRLTDKAAIICFAALAPLALTAATERYWQNGDGDWTDKTHWSSSKLPASDEWASWAADQSATVNVNTNARIGIWTLKDRGSGDVTTVRWTGTGTITNMSTSTTYLGTRRHLIIDGPDVYVTKALSVHGTNACLEVRSGHLHTDNGITVYKDSSLLVSGGRLTSSVTVNKGAEMSVTDGSAYIHSTCSIHSNAVLSLSGGTLTFSAAPTLPASAFSFTGGKIVWANTTELGPGWAHLLPPAGTIFEHRSSGCGFRTSSATTYDFDGTYVATNRNTGHPYVYNYKTSLGFTGNGTFIVDAFRIRNGYTTTIRSKALKLGSGLKSETSGDATYSFPSGIEFGAWDDWDNNDKGSASYVPNIRLAGRVAFDTLDCIDGATARTITLVKCADSGMKSLFASGGGTVSLTFSGGISALDELVVEEDSTLWLTNSSGSVSVKRIRLGDGAFLNVKAPVEGCDTVILGAGATLWTTNSTITAKSIILGEGASLHAKSLTAGCNSIVLGAGATLDIPGQSSVLRPRKLVLGDNARILMTVGLGSLEAQLPPVVGDGAKIILSMPQALTAGKLHAIWGAPAWDGDLSSLVEIDGLDGSGWTLKRVGAVAYLSDGTIPAVTGNSTTPEWIGETSSLWSEKSNWTADTVLKGQKYGYFGRDVNPYVTNDVARSIRYPFFRSNSGPYYLAGEQITLTYGTLSNNNSNSIRDDSPMPVVIDNYLVFSGADAFIRNTGSSCLLLRGGGRAVGGIHVSGDVRLGGEWRGTTAALLSSSARLTVLPGAVLTLTATGEAFNAPSWLAVDGFLDVSNTLASVSSAYWLGNGAVRIRDVDTGQTASFTLGDSLTLYPLNGWPTVSSDAPTAAVTISAAETPTLGAQCNWRYGPAAGAEPETTEAERALKVAADATLSIDTQNPETGAGHVITFSDPIMGDGSVVKTGAGTLSFATTNSVVAGTFRVEEGSISLSGAAASAAEKGWTRVIAAGTLVGAQEALPPRFKSRIVESDGMSILEVRSERHTVIMLK